MTDLEKAARQALEWIEANGRYENSKVVATSLRKALANEALERMAENARELGLDYEPAQQEPVACKHSRYSVDAHEQTGHCYDCGAEGRMKFVVDDAPPKREWVGLTDEERNKLWREVVGWGDPSHDDEDLMKAIEAKLMEKNA